jgi:hypothetical protein
MANTFDPRTYKSGSYTTRRLNQTGSGIYGSTRAADFLDDVIDGKDSLDVIVIGDSNTGFSTSGTAGWVYGLEYALRTAGANAYGTGVFPTAYSVATNTVEGRVSDLNVDAYQNRSAGQSGGSAFVTLGSASGITAITDMMNWGQGKFRPYGPDASTANGGVDWAYTASGTNQQNSLFIELKSNSSLGVTSQFKYRIVYVTFNSGSGSFKLIAHQGTTGSIIAGNRISTNTGSVGYGVATLNVPADPARAGTYVRFCRAGGNYTSLDHGIYGPCGFLLESVYKNIKGFAVTSLGYYGGGWSGPIKDGLINCGDTLTTYLREMRQRQIDAGGSGRVLVFWHSGANDGTGISDWHNNASAGMQAIRNKWKQLNYPEHDLCFVAMVSHPKANPDDMATGRALSKNLTSQSPTNDVTVLDFTEMNLGFQDLTGLGAYAPSGTTHLTNDGYKDVMSDFVFPAIRAR